MVSSGSIVAPSRVATRMTAALSPAGMVTVSVAAT